MNKYKEALHRARNLFEENIDNKQITKVLLEVFPELDEVLNGKVKFLQKQKNGNILYIKTKKTKRVAIFSYLSTEDEIVLHCSFDLSFHTLGYERYIPVHDCEIVRFANKYERKSLLYNLKINGYVWDNYDSELCKIC